MLAFGARCLIGICIVLLLLYETFLLCLLLVEAEPSREISEASMVDSTVIEGRCDPRLNEAKVPIKPYLICPVLAAITFSAACAKQRQAARCLLTSSCQHDRRWSLSVASSYPIISPICLKEIRDCSVCAVHER